MRKCVAIDFDGVIHKYSKGWGDGSVYDTLDFKGIDKVHAAGYSAAVMTSRDVQQVAQCFPVRYSLVVDLKCERYLWNGGKSGREILITNRKVAAIAYVDDRAIYHCYGDDWDKTLRIVHYVEEEKNVK